MDDDEPTKAPPADEEPTADAATTEADGFGGGAGDNSAPASETGTGSDAGGAAIRPVFLGNLSPTYTHDDVVNIFHKPVVPPGMEGEGFKPVAVDRLDQKRGYCFVFLKDAESPSDKENAEKFVSAIHGMEVAGVSTSLRAEFARGDGRIKKKEEDRKRNIQPSETLFVVNFNEETTKREDLKMLFEPYGELVRIDMKRNYAFIQFSSIEEASRAKEVTDGGKLESNVLTVEFVARKRGNRDDRGGGGRGGGRRGSGGGDDRGGYRRGNYDRFDRPPPDRYDRYDDRGGGPRNDDRRRDDRYGDRGGYRGRSPSPPPRSGGGGGAYRSRSRSRSRSPPRYRDDRGGYRGRSPSPPRGGRGYDERDRYDNVRDGGRGYDDRDRDRDRYDDRGRDDRGYRY